MIGKLLLWLGRIVFVFGVLLILGNIAAYFMDMSASYNFGDPTKFEFILVPFWQLGLAAIAISLVIGLISKAFR